MAKVELNREQKEAFKEALREFIAQVDGRIETGLTTGTTPGAIQDNIQQNFLNGINFKCKVSFGQGMLAGYSNKKEKSSDCKDDEKYPAIAFCRNDILGDEFVNGKTFAQGKGLFIWIGYRWNKQPKEKLELRLTGASKDKENRKCAAGKRIFGEDDEPKYQKSFELSESSNIDSTLDSVINYFLELVEIFNSIPRDDFKISSSNKTEQKESAMDKPPLNQILYGPPGTGKTYHTINKALEILGFAKSSSESNDVVLDCETIKETLQGLGIEVPNKDRECAKALFDYYRTDRTEGQIEFVTFHQSYGYEEFVEGIKPVLDSQNSESSDVGYKIEDGIFKKICKRAQNDTQKPYILIIDEINRGNISKILGELITLLEESKREGAKEGLKLTLPYSKESFSVPQNLYIIGTMNTADRSIALLDTALRRRFEFIEMMPDSSLLSEDCEGINLQRLLESLNNRIEFLLGREQTIGHAFLIDIENIESLRAAFQNKIIPLLQEYFYDDYARIAAVLNNGMIEAKSMKDLGVSFSDEMIDSEKLVYRITESKGWNAETFKKIYE